MPVCEMHPDVDLPFHKMQYVERTFKIGDRNVRMHGWFEKTDTVADLRKYAADVAKGVMRPRKDPAAVEAAFREAKKQQGVEVKEIVSVGGGG